MFKMPKFFSMPKSSTPKAPKVSTPKPYRTPKIRKDRGFSRGPRNKKYY